MVKSDLKIIHELNLDPDPLQDESRNWISIQLNGSNRFFYRYDQKKEDGSKI